MNHTQRLQRVQNLTVDEWVRLPWLLPRAVVVEWTGLSARDLEDLIRGGRLRIHVTKRKRKFLKSDVGILIGIAGPDCGRLSAIGADEPRKTCQAGQFGPQSTV